MLRDGVTSSGSKYGPIAGHCKYSNDLQMLLLITITFPETHCTMQFVSNACIAYQVLQSQTILMDMVYWLTSLIGIREVTGSNLGEKLSRMTFHMDSPLPPGTFYESTLKLTTSASLY
jgi:hypothetical protein